MKKMQSRSTERIGISMSSIGITVRLLIEDGNVFVNDVPEGVTVEVTDLDVLPCSKQRAADGRPCSRYSVTAKDRRQFRKHAA